MKEKIADYIKKTYGILPEHPWEKYPEHATFKARENEKWFALMMSVDAAHLGLCGDGLLDVLNVKADPSFIALMAGRDGFLPAYHMNKRLWLTVLLDGTVPFREVSSRIDESFRIVTDTPAKRIYEAVRRIPRGKVATYGDVAEMAGDRKMARAVGNALHKNPDPDNIPCYRVVNAKGQLAGEYVFGGAWEQAKLLAADGIEVKDGAVDLAKYRISIPG